MSNQVNNHESDGNSGELIPDFLCQIPYLRIINLSGEQNISYLQGQVTADINNLSQDNVLLSCHCDAKGKTLSVFNTLLWQENLVMIMHQGGFQASFDALKKFGVFAKTEIEDKTSDFKFLAGKGQSTQALIEKLFGALPETNHSLSNDLGFVIHFSQPESRYLIALTETSFENVELDNLDISDDAQLWQLMDIQAGIPHIDEATSAEFIPQMMNLQALNAISFSKGCYMGQETVARSKYLGKNKRAAFVLRASSAIDLESGATLESQVGENWRRGGTLLSSASYQNETWALAVLANDTAVGAKLRMKDTPDIVFTVQPLPYSLEE